MKNRRLPELLYRGFWTALDWIYPPVCVGCGEPGYRLCVKCFEKVRFIAEPVCNTCGFPLALSGNSCSLCKRKRPPYNALRSLAQYEGVIRDCVHALKYHNNLSLGELFSTYLVALVVKEKWRIDLVIPVPLSPFRIEERGYNQSALLARPLAMHLGFRYNPYGLIRTRNTRSQVELSVSERYENVAGAFEANPEIVKKKNVLLVDDVTTTGATLEACTLALKSAGASAIYCVTLARPIHADAVSHNKPASSIIELPNPIRR